MEIVLAVSIFIFIGLLFYFRFTDARSANVTALKKYVVESQQHIENFISKREKEFDDRIISAEIIIERMHRLTLSMQEKVNLFEGEVTQGQSIFDSLKQELSSLSDELFTYKQIRLDFKDIEDRVNNVVDMKTMVEDGFKGVNILKDKMSQFSYEYDTFTSDVKKRCKQELEQFFSVMQKDLSAYLGKARQQLADQDKMINTQMDDLNSMSGTIVNSCQEVKDFLNVNLENLKQECQNDLDLAKVIAHTNLTEVYDMWTKLREDTQQDRDDIGIQIASQEVYFKEAHEALREESRQFRLNLENLSKDVQGHIEMGLEDRFMGMDEKLQNFSFSVDQKVLEVQNLVENILNTKIALVQSDLDRMSSSFSDQELLVNKRMQTFAKEIENQYQHIASEFEDSLRELQSRAQEARGISDEILNLSKEQVEEKIKGFEGRFEDSLRELQSRAMESLLADMENIISEVNQGLREQGVEKISQSINEVITSLKQEYNAEYQDTVDLMYTKVNNLDAIINKKFKAIDLADEKGLEIIQRFNLEKDKIIEMVEDLDKQKKLFLEQIVKDSSSHVDLVRKNLSESLQEIFNEKIEDWDKVQGDREKELGTALDQMHQEYLSVKNDINGLQDVVDSFQNNTLSEFRDEISGLVGSSKDHFVQFKQELSDHFRVSKETFQYEIDQAKSHIKDLKQELRDEEKEVRGIIQEDIDRFSLKIKDLDKQFQNFMKKTEKFDKAEDLVMTMGARYTEMLALRKDLQNTIQNLKDSFAEGHKVIDECATVKKTLEERSEKLLLSSAEAQKAQDFLMMAVEEVNSITDVFAILQAEKLKAQEIEDLLLRNLEKFEGLQESLQDLERKKILVDEMMGLISNSQQELTTLSTAESEVSSRVQDIDRYANDIYQKMLAMQSEMKEITGEQTTLKVAVSKLQDLEHIILHIDEEMKRLEKMRDWIAKAMTNIERAGLNIGVAKESEDLEDVNVKNILRLYDKSWNIPDIAKNLKLSDTFVELILERYRT